MTKKEHLINAMRDFANTNEFEGVLLHVQIPDYPSNEQIFNPRENFLIKSNYIEKAYNDELELINNPNIKIVDTEFIATYPVLDDDDDFDDRLDCGCCDCCGCSCDESLGE